MKVVAINGSPHKNGNTYNALKMVGKVLEEDGIDFEIIHIGKEAVRDCISCGKCGKTRDDKCAINTDSLNEWIQIIKDADGIILGSPVYYSGISGTMKCFLDRLFIVSGNNGNYFRNKVGAAVVALRRSGGSATLDNLYHYLTYSEMMIATSNYWNIIHGAAQGQVLQDEEGVQIMEVLGKNMAWMLKMREMTKVTLPAPEKNQKVYMNFIR
jgi:multimeric flavodoxin WrbA